MAAVHVTKKNDRIGFVFSEEKTKKNIRALRQYIYYWRLILMKLTSRNTCARSHHGLYEVYNFTWTKRRLWNLVLRERPLRKSHEGAIRFITGRRRKLRHLSRYRFVEAGRDHDTHKIKDSARDTRAFFVFLIYRYTRLIKF